MIAPIRESVSYPKPISHHDKFLTMLPLIREQARMAFRRQRPELRDELIQEVVANAYCAFARLVARGKEEAAFATPLAQFAIRQVRAGRRVGTKLNCKDMTSIYAQRAKGIRIGRLDKFDPVAQEWQEILVEDRRAGPADVAASRIDTAAWLRSLPARNRRIARVLAKGETTKTTATMFDVSAGRISQLRRELHESWLAMQGELVAA